ncbi:hypothetical protein [Burkholderia phage BCSR5]|nr:hypothetical protein [Burkholderia phage BCSR5]
MSNIEMKVELAEVSQKEEAPEVNRGRERRSFTATPPTAAELDAGVVDFSEALTEINFAQRELTEAISAGQKERTLAAYAKLRKYTDALGQYITRTLEDAHWLELAQQARAGGFVGDKTEAE